MDMLVLWPWSALPDRPCPELGDGLSSASDAKSQPQPGTLLKQVEQRSCKSQGNLLPLGDFFFFFFETKCKSLSKISTLCIFIIVLLMPVIFRRYAVGRVPEWQLRNRWSGSWVPLWSTHLTVLCHEGWAPPTHAVMLTALFHFRTILFIYAFLYVL